MCNCPTDVCTQNLWQKAERGKNTGSESTTRFRQASCFEKSMHSVPETVVPMEITFMDNGGNIFVLCEFIDVINSYIIQSHTNEFKLDEFIWNPYRFLISSLGLPTFFLRIAKRER
jgi:hypothetical protein